MIQEGWPQPNSARRDTPQSGFDCGLAKRFGGDDGRTGPVASVGPEATAVTTNSLAKTVFGLYKTN